MSYFTTGHFHIGYMCTLQRMKPISLFILGSVFSDCVVFYGDFLLPITLLMTILSFNRIALVHHACNTVKLVKRELSTSLFSTIRTFP